MIICFRGLQSTLYRVCNMTSVCQKCCGGKERLALLSRSTPVSYGGPAAMGHPSHEGRPQSATLQSSLSAHCRQSGSAQRSAAFARSCGSQLRCRQAGPALCVIRPSAQGYDASSARGAKLCPFQRATACRAPCHHRCAGNLCRSLKP